MARRLFAVARTPAELAEMEINAIDALIDKAGFHLVKCANLTLGIACAQPRIGVDTHVHRITNRWGYVSGRTPEINAVLVPFGKHVCTPTAPRCSSCPLLDMCAQRGVESHR